MRIQTALLIASLATVVGCGPNEIEMGGGGVGPTPTPSGTATPTPTATPGPTPNPTLFNPVQTFMEDAAKANCGQATCHDTATASAGLVWYTAVGTLPADVEKNRVTWSCSPNLETYTPVVSSIATQFCASATTALVGMNQHVGRTAIVDQDCVDLYAYLGSGTNPTTPCP